MASKLIKDLNSVANIVGGLGLSVAAAQRALNLDYLESLERVVTIAIALQQGTKPAPAPANPPTVDYKLTEEERKFVQDFLSKFAPGRYQYGETTLSVRLDLAQTLSASGSLGLGVAVGAIAVNASFAFAYGSEYQAAAECKTILQAVPASLDAAMFEALSSRAAGANAKDLKLPERAEVDTQIKDTSSRIIGKLVGFTPAEIKEEKEPEKKS